MKFSKVKRILCSLLSVLMIASFVPMQSISASATEDSYAGGIAGYAPESGDDYVIDSADQLAGVAVPENSGGIAGGIAGYVPGSNNTSSDITIENTYDQSGSQSRSGNCTGDHNGYTAISSSRNTITTAGKYYLSKDIVENMFYPTLTVDCSGEVTICLNGYKIEQTNGQVNAQSLLDVANGTVNLCDCKGTGYLHHAGNESAVYLQNSSVLNMYGGTIKDTYRFRGGSAIYAGGTSTFNMYGGTITNNTASSDEEIVYINTDAKFNMYGGSITGNKQMAYPVFGNNTYISGNAKISGNTNGNLYLKSGKTITVGQLTEGAEIWVNAQDSGNVAITGKNSSDVSKYFHSDDSNRVIINKDNVVMLHAHEWQAATCGSAKYCDYCGQYEGEKNPDNHTSDETYIRYVDDATHNEYYSCCNGLKAVHSHTADVAATCTDVAYCDSCKSTFGSTNSENHTGTLHYVDLENGKHIQQYDCCGAYFGEAVEHTFNCETLGAESIHANCVYCDEDTTITFRLSESSYSYDGSVKTPEVLVYADDCYTLVEGVDYDVVYLPELSVNAGVYEATVTMKGRFKGILTLTYFVDPIAVSDSDITIENENLTYNGDVQTPVISVKTIYGATLVEGIDYTVVYSSDSKTVGTYSATVTMKGNYTGNKTLSYNIVPAPISSCDVSIESSVKYNSKVQTPAVTVKGVDGAVLTEGTDYTVAYSSSSKIIGTYSATVTMKGNYTGNKTLSYKIVPASVNDCTITLSKTSYTYNGKAKKPTVSVRNANGALLTNGKHYSVTYASGRINVGTYKVTVKMLDKNYTGSKTLTFKINPISIDTCTIKLSKTSYTYNAKVQTPTVSVKNSSGTALKKDTHYTVSYSSGRKNAGTYNVTVTMKGHYGGTKTLSYKIKPIDVSTCTAKLSKTSYTYNGSNKTPSVTVKNAGGTTLTKDTHYTVSYPSERKNANTYKVTVTMKGNYTGTKTLSYKINPADISTCTVKLSKTSYTYNGSVKTPSVSVKLANGTALTKDTHYTVAYESGRKNVGTYDVTVTMKGNYKGSKTLSFKINPSDISNCTVKLSKTSYTYNGKVKTPSVSVMLANGTALTKDTHYTVAYESGRKNAGTYDVTVTMKGNYKGSKTLSFKIKPIDISTCTLSLNKIKYTYDGNAKSPYPVIKNEGGTTLTKDTHYTFSYETTRKSVGEHGVVIKMKGNYTGTNTLYFDINPPKTTINSLSGGTKSISVKINNIKSISGYVVTYSKSEDFTDSEKVTVSTTKAELEKATKTVKLTGLTAGKTYYVKVRTYKTVDGVKYYSSWSSYKYAKAK